MHTQHVFSFIQERVTGGIFGTGARDYRRKNNYFSVTNYFVTATSVFSLRKIKS